MKTKMILLLVVLFVTNNLLYSQASVAEMPAIAAAPDSNQGNTYESESIYLNGAMTRYTKNKTEKRMGFFRKRLEPEFTDCSEESKAALAGSIKHKKRGTILLSSGGAVWIVALVAAPLAPPVALGAFLVGLIPYSIGAVDLNESDDELQKAVWLHNRDILRK